jgi:hypothetical protein
MLRRKFCQTNGLSQLSTKTEWFCSKYQSPAYHLTFNIVNIAIGCIA